MTKRSALAGFLWFLSLALLFVINPGQSMSQDIGLRLDPAENETVDTSTRAAKPLSIEALKLNRQFANHPECSKTRPLLMNEIIDAINKFSKPNELSAAEFAAIKRIAEDHLLPDNIQLHQFVRYHSGQTVQHGRWVRLIAESASGFPFSIEIRNEVAFERPLTQRERWAHHQIEQSGEFMLLGRFVSWFSQVALFNELVKQSIDYTPLASEVEMAIEDKNLDRFMAIVYQDGVAPKDLLHVRRELELLIERGISEIEIEPRRYAGHSQHAQGLESFESNLTVEAYLKITLKKASRAKPDEQPETLWLELGNAVGEPKLVCYVVSEDRSRELIGKPLSSPLRASGGYYFKRSEQWTEFGGMKIEAPEEFRHLREANFELWKLSRSPIDKGADSKEASAIEALKIPNAEALDRISKTPTLVEPQ